MSEAILSAPHFHDSDAAREYLETLRWADGVVCPHCGTVSKDHRQFQGSAHRPGVWKCRDCQQQFTVTVGTVFEDSKVPLHKWLVAAYRMAASKKGISSMQLKRELGVAYKTAWFMTHRLREAMKSEGGIFGGSAPVEGDATYVGGKEKNKHRSKRDPKNIGGMGKECVFSLVQRGGGVRSFHVPSVNAKNLKPILEAQLLDAVNTRLMTDGERPLRALATLVSSHETVNHEAGEYVRGDVHTNTIEGYFSLLKRGIIGTFHHVSPQHLQKYCTEFDFRYSNRETKIKVDGHWVKAGLNDTERMNEALKGIAGKRLTYRA